MDHLSRLISVLRESVEVSNVDESGFDVTVAQGGTGGDPVRVVASEEVLRQYAARHAEDALTALGPVGDDHSGVVAAIGLLAVHIEEELVVDSAVGEVVELRVEADGVRVRRR